MRKLTLGFGLAVLAAIPTGAMAAPCDWQEIDTHKVIEVETTDEGGGARRTKVWIVLLDGVPYLRTSDSRWLANLRRNSGLVIRAGECQVNATAEEVDEDGLVDTIDAASATKYGWQQRMTRFFRYRKPEILRLTRVE